VPSALSGALTAALNLLPLLLGLKEGAGAGVKKQITGQRIPSSPLPTYFFFPGDVNQWPQAEESSVSFFSFCDTKRTCSTQHLLKLLW